MWYSLTRKVKECLATLLCLMVTTPGVAADIRIAVKQAGAFLLCMALSVAISAQSIQWQKAWGGTADDMVLTIKQTADEGYIMGGVTASKDGDVTNSKGKGDMWVVKLRPSGTLHWKKTLGGSNEEQGCNVIETSDGGYLVAGNTSSNNGDVKGYHGGTTDIWGSGGYDIWVVKLSSTGAILWQRCLGGSKVDEVVNIKEVPGGYLIAGNTNSADGDVQGQHGDYDIWLVRLNINGTIGWQKTLGGPGTEKIRDVQEQNGMYYFAGYTTANGGDVTGYHGNTDIWIGSIGENVPLWQKSLGGSNRESDFSTYIRPTSDGGFLVGGYTMSQDGDVTEPFTNEATWLLKYDNHNNLTWQKFIAEGDGVGAFKKTNDDGCIFLTTVTVTNSEQRTRESRLIKMAPDGSITWSTIVPGRPMVIDVTNLGEVVTFGYTSNALIPGYKKGFDAWVMKLDASGNIDWNRAYGGSNNDFLPGSTAVYTGNTFPISTSIKAPWDTYIPAVAAKDGGYFFAVSTGSNDGDVSGFHYSSKVGYRFDIWVVKVVPAVSSAVTKQVQPTSEDFHRSFKHVVYPNPTRQSATVQFIAADDKDVTIELFSITGARLQSHKINNTALGSIYSVPVDLSTLATGTYVYKIKNGAFTASGQIIHIE